MELVVVLVLLGIVAATVGVRLGGSGSNLGATADRLASDLRTVQSLAQTRAQRHCVSFAAGNYTVTNNNCATVINLPTSANPVAMPSGITLASTDALLVFNGLGRPFTDAAATTPLAAEAVVTLSAGTESTTVRVTPETGRVRVQ
jgi:type II secretory pathway pseudopilin PulG